MDLVVVQHTHTGGYDSYFRNYSQGTEIFHTAWSNQGSMTLVDERKYIFFSSMEDFSGGCRMRLTWYTNT